LAALFVLLQDKRVLIPLLNGEVFVFVFAILTIRKPTYCELVPESRNWEGCGKKGTSIKRPCVAWLALLCLVCVAAASQLVVTQ